MENKNIKLEIIYNNYNKEYIFISLKDCHDFLFNEFRNNQTNIKALRAYYEDEGFNSYSFL